MEGRPSKKHPSKKQKPAQNQVYSEQQFNDLETQIQGNEAATEYLALLRRQQQLQQEEKELRQQGQSVKQSSQESIKERKHVKQSQPQKASGMMAWLRYLLGVGVIGPLAGLARYAISPLPLLLSTVAILFMMLVFPSVSWTFALSVGLICHAGVALYQTFIAKPSVTRDDAPKTTEDAYHFIQEQTLSKPIPNAILFGFKAANHIAGSDNEPYGKQACDLCLQLENPKLPRARS